MVTEAIALLVGTNVFTVALADTPAATNFASRLPLTFTMTEFNSNEKYAGLAEPLPSKPERHGRIESGDVMLWGDDTLVVFYASFQTPYSYTRIGKIKNPAGLAAALGKGDARVSFDKTGKSGK